ncbi:uncharacterized protein LOC134223814 [Armigeres subalbatus]|uniref:uncharacterized protein LOC134223814 n=1 Tax=Armigeres subalbatus TaxID=124917 RepID=UPI002ED3ADD3
MQPIKSFYYFSKLFGLCPFPLDAITAGNVRMNHIKQLIPTYLALLFYTFCLVSIFWQTGNSSDISNAANWIQFIPNSFAYIFVLIFAIRHRMAMSDILSTFALCDEKMRSMFGISYTIPNIKMRRVAVLACVVTLSCGGTLGGLNFMIGVNLNKIWTLFYWFAFVVPKFGLLLFNFQFAGCIMFLSDRSILLLKGMNTFPNSFGLEQQFKPLNLVGLGKQSSMTDKKLNRVTTVGNIKIRPVSPAETVQNTREVVEYLQELATKINDCFGKQAIFSLLSAFICVTVQLYYMLNHIKTGFSQSQAEIYALAACSMLFLHGVEFWALFTSGENARYKWKNLINYVFFIKSKSNDEEFRCRADDLISFMHANPLEFHAYGLFPIDLSVVSGIAASITTYLIVLIQFKISEEQTNGEEIGSEGIDKVQYSSSG